MRKNDNRRSLKKRITRMVSMLNFSSLLIMLIALMIALGISMSLISNIISQNVANQMGVQLQTQWNKAIHEKKIPKKFVKLNSVYVQMFKRLGYSYKFFGSNKENISPKRVPDDINIMPGIMQDLLTVEYRVWNNKSIIFDSSTSNNINIVNKLPHKDSLIMKALNTTTNVSLKSDDGSELGKLEVKLNPNIIFGGYVLLILICVIIFLIILSISRIFIGMLSRAIVKPLFDLDEKMKQLANGNLEAAMNTEIVFKKPIKEVESLANSTNIIMSRMNEYINALGNQKVELEAQNVSLQENSSTLENINLVLANKNSKLKNILNNVEQGFLTFKKDLFIHGEYSQVCEKFFNKNISGKTLASILFPQNMNMQKFTDELLVKIFECSNSERKLYMPLLPEEIAINENVINISYKVVKDEKNEDSIMVIITDITEKRLLEKQMDEERKILKMVVKSIINRDEFLELIKEYEDFTNELNKKVSRNEYEQILRQIHTFKGNFSQYDMVNLVPELNELEDKIYLKDIEFNFSDIDNMQLKQWLKDDLDIIVSYAGKDFLRDGEYCYIKKEKLIEIEKKIQQTLSHQECNVILPLIKSLSYKSVKDLLKTYPDYVMKLSERLEKSIKPIDISGSDIMVDTSYYMKISKALSHIFRNCVDHGIETEDERLEIGKEQLGKISCEIKDLKDSFQIIISDDGRGIDLSALEDKVINDKLYTRDEWNNMTLKQKYNLIFEQGITTKEEATYISGRGVGMSAVKQCVVEIGGTITVDSAPGKGTVFTLTLPKLEEFETNVITTERFMEEMVRTSKEIIFKQTGLNFVSEDIETKNMIVLNNTTAILSLSGTLNSIIIISVNELVAKSLVHCFIVDSIKENDTINYIEDVLGELTNIILGNVFGKFENTRSIFHIGLPAVLSNNGAYIKYTESQIISCKLIYDEYEISISMLLVEDETSTNELGE